LPGGRIAFRVVDARLRANLSKDAQMKKAWIVFLVIALLPSSAGAVTASEARKHLEYSLLVKGEIETNAEGEVSSVNVEKPEKFPPGLVDYVKQQVSGWKFEPVLVAGKPVRARSSMSLLVVAKKLANKEVSIGIRNASFGRHEFEEGEFVSALSKKPPVYPHAMQAQGVAGTVYVLLKIGRDGTVQDAAVEKVNLRVLGKEHAMESWRAALSEAALGALKAWTFAVPTKGKYADDQSWSIWAPVDFELINARGEPVDARGNTIAGGYGKWKTYVRGPSQPIPWLAEDRPGFSSDSLEEGGVYMAEKDMGPKLLTPLDGS
jgi:hypothetical protein